MAVTLKPKNESQKASEYTAEQRRVIDARLADAEEDIKAGRVHGPFSAKEASAFIERLAQQRTGKKSNRTLR
jgi:hypothetical protein